ncbi:MAG: ATP-binding protein [Candidatus Aminicenantia bacterium]
MEKIFSFFFKNKFSSQPSSVYPWHFFKELEHSLDLIEDLDQIGLNFLGKIREIIPVKKQILILYDNDLGRFKVSNYFGFDELQVKEISFSRAEPLVKWLKVNETYLYVKHNLGLLNYLTEKEKDILNKLDIELCFPLISMNRLIGMIFIGPRQDKEDFDKEELSLIFSLTPQIGIALENAVLYKEQRERFRKMSRADKLATVGELAAGAAHEIRNPLTAIKSSLQYLQTKSLPEIKDKKMLQNAIQETERIDRILSDLLSFARPSELRKEKINLLDVLNGSIDLISPQAKKQKVKITKAFLSSPLFIVGDFSQLKQLFLNLFLNSVQAMKKGGELKIETIPSRDEEVMIVISDTGEGISEENLDKIFDPFFTTKKQGTGLGLSICYGIVDRHQGEIEVRSKVGQGTAVIVKFKSE